MKSEKLVKHLASEFGSNNTRVCNEYHVQVLTKGWNDIWLNKHGELKFKLFGSRTSIKNIGIETIKKYLKQHKKTHLEKMKEMLNLPEFIKKTEKLSATLNINKAIFVDAGFKNGKAKAAYIFIHNKDIDVKVRNIEVKNNYEAECFGIEMAIKIIKDRFSPTEIPIFTDNKVASQEYQKRKYDVRWIPRENNKIADKLSNLRK